MKEYTVTGRVAQFTAGRVELSDHQAHARLHNLKDLGKGIYEIVNPIEFKNGEKFGYDGEVPKIMASVVEKAGRAGSAAPAPQENTEKSSESDSTAGSGDTGAAADKKAPDAPKKLTATALKKLNKLVLFGMLPIGNELDFEASTKDDFIKVILGS